MIELKEVLRQWLAGAGKKRIAARVGLDPKTVRRYVRAAEGLGLRPGAGDTALTDDHPMAANCSLSFMRGKCARRSRLRKLSYFRPFAATSSASCSVGRSCSGGSSQTSWLRQSGSLWRSMAHTTQAGARPMRAEIGRSRRWAIACSASQRSSSNTSWAKRWRASGMRSVCPEGGRCQCTQAQAHSLANGPDAVAKGWRTAAVATAPTDGPLGCPRQ